MTRARQESGFTLIEMLVALVITTVLLTSVALLLAVIMDNNTYDTLRAESQSNVQTIMDRLSRQLRDAAGPITGAAGLLGKAASYDVAFENVAGGTAPTGNPDDQVWVRYCLDAHETLWRQTTPASSTTSTLPDTSACPSTNSAWVTQTNGSPCCQVINDVTNEIGGDTTRPLFVYGPTGWASTAAINSVEVNLYVDNNPDKQPGPTELTSAIFLRNDVSPPTASFTITQTVSGSSASVALNGSASSDPQGQALTYQWYSGVSCPTSGAPTSGAISGATTQSYSAGSFTGGKSQTFALVVTDTAGLTSCQSQTVTIA